MAPHGHGNNNEARWRSVQSRVRDLAHTHEWFAEAIRQGFTDFIELYHRYIRQLDDNHQRERALARDLLTRGLIVDPATSDNSPCLFFTVRGLCPVHLAKRLHGYSVNRPPTDKLGKDAAAAALLAFDRDTIYQSPDLPTDKKHEMVAEWNAAIDGGNHVDFNWQLCMLRPKDWAEPPSPYSFDRQNMQRFTDSEFRTIALFRLGGVADHGAVRLIVQRPTESGDGPADMVAWRMWESRIHAPADPGEGAEMMGEAVGTGTFKVDIGEQMLAEVEKWARLEEQRRSQERERETIRIQEVNSIVNKLEASDAPAGPPLMASSGAPVGDGTPDDRQPPKKPKVTKADVDNEIQKRKARMGPEKLEDLRKKVVKGDRSAMELARDTFGRNEIARHLDCSGSLVTDSPRWGEVADQLQLRPRKSSVRNKQGFDVVIEQKAVTGPSAADDAARREISSLLGRVSRDTAKLIQAKLGSGQMTPAQAIELIRLESNPDADESPP